MLRHLDKVTELAQLQHERNLGFIVISKPPITTLEQSNKMLSQKFSGLAVEQLGVGICSDGLIVNNSLSTQVVTNVNQIVTSLKHCSKHIEKKQSIESLYSLSTTDVFVGVLDLLKDKASDIWDHLSFCEQRIASDSTLSPEVFTMLQQSDLANK